MHQHMFKVVIRFVGLVIYGSYHLFAEIYLHLGLTVSLRPPPGSTVGHFPSDISTKNCLFCYDIIFIRNI